MSDKPIAPVIPLKGREPKRAFRFKEAPSCTQHLYEVDETTQTILCLNCKRTFTAWEVVRALAEEDARSEQYADYLKAEAEHLRSEISTLKREIASLKAKKRHQLSLEEKP